MDIREVLELARSAGFSHAGELNVEGMQFVPEVRDMCAADRCHSYGKCWTCPPHCGTLEQTAEKARRYSRGILIQSTGQMEDDFDIECMMETEALHKQRFHALVKNVRTVYPDCLPMGSGTCTICQTCTCPDTPCRFPNEAISSMEAYGLVVSEVCRQSGMEYYYGPRTITYTACILLD